MTMVHTRAEAISAVLTQAERTAPPIVAEGYSVVNALAAQIDPETLRAALEELEIGVSGVPQMDEALALFADRLTAIQTPEELRASVYNCIQSGVGIGPYWTPNQLSEITYYRTPEQLLKGLEEVSKGCVEAFIEAVADHARDIQARRRRRKVAE